MITKAAAWVVVAASALQHQKSARRPSRCLRMRAQERQPKYGPGNSTVGRPQLPHLRRDRALEDCEDGAVVGVTPARWHRTRRPTRLVCRGAWSRVSAESSAVDECPKARVNIGRWSGSRRFTPLWGASLLCEREYCFGQRRRCILTDGRLVKPTRTPSSPPFRM